MDFQELKLSLSEMEARLQDIKDNILLIDNKKTRLNEIDSELSKEEVWSDLEPVSYTHLTLPTIGEV